MKSSSSPFQPYASQTVTSQQLFVQNRISFNVAGGSIRTLPIPLQIKSTPNDYYSKLRKIIR
jgi:hypothetical protein